MILFAALFFLTQLHLLGLLKIVEKFRVVLAAVWISTHKKKIPTRIEYLIAVHISKHGMEAVDYLFKAFPLSAKYSQPAIWGSVWLF